MTDQTLPVAPLQFIDFNKENGVALTLKENNVSIEKPYNLNLLDKAINQIEAHPETWEQGDWRCETGMCVAGWVVTLNGDQWANEDPEEFGSDLVLVPEGTEGSLDGKEAEYFTTNGVQVPEGKALIHADRRAEQLLGLGRDHDLFTGSNSLTNIKDMRDQMVRGATPTRDFYNKPCECGCEG